MSPTNQEKIANATPLGLAAFALTTFILSVHNAGFTALQSFLPWAIFYGGVAQFAAGMWEFKRGDVFPATAFSSYGMFWMGLAGAVLLLEFGVISMATFASIEKVSLISWTIFTFYMWIGTFKTNKALVSTFTMLLATFILLDMGIITEIHIIQTIGGISGIITAFCAWYISAAEIIEESWGREVLPLGELS